MITIPNPYKKFIRLVTYFLLVILILLRLYSRNLNPLWEDEIEEISHLKTVSHLILQYLPSIPGALPGHYLLALPMNYIAPGNKFILGIPGLLTHIGVFLLIPTAIYHLRIVSKKDITFVSFIARAGFVFDPRLIYQSMEIRPYSILPLLWIASVIICSKLFELENDRKKVKDKVLHFLLLIVPITAIFSWHFYGFIMLTTIFLFMRSQQKSKTLLTISVYPIIISAMISIPIWKYFTSGLSQYHHDTFLFLSYLPKMNSIYTLPTIGIAIGIMLFITILILSYKYRTYLLPQAKEFLHNRVILLIIKLIFCTVLLPIIIIFILDLVQPYYFLYRQFSWVAISFYIAIGVISNSILFKRIIRKKND